MPTPSVEFESPGLTVGELPVFEHRVRLDTPTSAVLELFERHPNLVGVMVDDEAGLFGVVSRAGMLERLSQPFAHELYMKRPIRQMHDVIITDPDVIQAG